MYKLMFCIGLNLLISDQHIQTKQCYREITVFMGLHRSMFS